MCIRDSTYDIPAPQVIAVYLTGTPRPGVGPQDVSLAIIKATYQNGFVKNKVMEFMGPGVANLSVDFRCGIDVMTTETTCLSSIWVTDEKAVSYTHLGYVLRPHSGPGCTGEIDGDDLGRGDIIGVGQKLLY